MIECASQQLGIELSMQTPKISVCTNVVMYKLNLTSVLLTCMVLVFVAPPVLANSTSESSLPKECVILLHGLARTSSSMNDLQAALLEANFVVAKIDYPSRKYTVQELAAPAIEQGLALCREQGAQKNHVVSHSMGGILFRQYVTDNGAEQFARTVMLAPPNKGSEAVDALRDVPGFDFLNGPAGLQLGTDSASLPLKLGPASSDVAVIAGTFSINLMLSTFLPDPDDGKVSVESSRLDGMCAHLQVHVSHPFIMEDEEVMPEVISYLKTGRFISDKAEYPDCAFR